MLGYPVPHLPQFLSAQEIGGQEHARGTGSSPGAMRIHILEASMPISIPAGWAVYPLLDLCISMIRAKYECVRVMCVVGEV